MERLDRNGSQDQSEKYDVNRVLTPEYASQILYYSFNYSQGEAGNHRNIFRYIHKIRPDWQITPQDRNMIFATTIGPAMKYVLPNVGRLEESIVKPTTHPRGYRRGSGKFNPLSVEWNVNEQITNMAAILNG